MKHIILVLSFMIIIPNFAIARDCTKTCPINKSKTACSDNCATYDKSRTDDAIKYKKYVQKIQNSRATVYNALNLSDEQIKVREELTQKNKAVFDVKFDQLSKESYKLKALTSANASNKEISQQKNIIKNIQKDIKKLLNEENRDFKKCLTRAQRSKYAMIEKLERNSYKKACHQKDYYKSNPQLKPFGNPDKQ